MLLLHGLSGTSPAALVAEIEQHASDWDLAGDVAQLARKPVLIVSADFGGAAQVAPVAAAIKGEGKGLLHSLSLPSDHSFADHRIALATVTVDWLNAQSGKAAGKAK